MSDCLFWTVIYGVSVTRGNACCEMSTSLMHLISSNSTNIDVSDLDEESRVF